MVGSVLSPANILTALLTYSCGTLSSEVGIGSCSRTQHSSSAHMAVVQPPPQLLLSPLLTMQR